MNDSLAHLAMLTDPQFNAEMSATGKRYVARRADELLAEDPTRSAQRLVELLRTEADAAKDHLPDDARGLSARVPRGHLRR